MLDSMAMRTSDANAPAAAAPLLPAVARSVWFRAGGRTLIEDVSLRLEPGSLTVVMGPNGAGKSILLRLLHGLLEPSAGEIRWGGQRMTDNVRRRQAMVFQRPVLLRRSVADNIRFALRLNADGDTRSCHEILESAGLDARADQPARSLSGGEQQRLALARALVLQPEVLFLDEPTANLDPASTAAIESVVDDARRRGTKIIFVSHDVGQAQRLADDVLFLHQGRALEHSPASDFFRHPAAAAAQAYLHGRLLV